MAMSRNIFQASLRFGRKGKILSVGACARGAIINFILRKLAPMPQQ
jgi:hypothetical protein